MSLGIVLIILGILLLICTHTLARENIEKHTYVYSLMLLISCIILMIGVIACFNGPEMLK